MLLLLFMAAGVITDTRDEIAEHRDRRAVLIIMLYYTYSADSNMKIEPHFCRTPRNGNSEWSYESAVRLITLQHGTSCDALAYLSRDAFELVRARDADIEMEADFGNGVDVLCEELAWLRVGNEALDSWLN